MGTSFATVSNWEIAQQGKMYDPTEGQYLAVIQGLTTGVGTSQFTNASGQAGIVGSILEREVTLEPGAAFSFDWAFLAGDMSPWNDFALFYLKDQNGAIVFSRGWPR